MRRAFFLFLLTVCSVSMSAQQQYNNPVLNMRDGCIERWRGYYYAMGGETAGKIYSSKDMVSWGNPVQGVTTDKATWLGDSKWTQASTYKRVGAGDILYRNGVFHTYFNGIGHCYAQEAQGPYAEQCIYEPFDDYGIDVQVFQDEDGQPYYVKKRNPSDPHPMTGAASNLTGPEVWAFRMNSLFSRWDITEGKVQMTHQPGHPTSLNHMNFEGPELARYRDRYYIFFAVNRMGPRSGMYEVGCAESDGPMNFNNSKKYPHPVVYRNTEDQLLRYKALAPTAEHGGWDASFTMSTPSGNWMENDYDDSSWSKSQGGFGFQEFDLYDNKTMTNARIRARKTFWKTTDLYIRRHFNVDTLPERAELKLWVNGSATVYINGTLFNTYTSSYNTYSAIDLDPKYLREGDNVIAVAVNSSNQSSTSQQFIDFGVYDTRGEQPEEIMINPAQPNFIAGPNGFERWMVYKAFINGVEKQSIDRIHFYGHEPVCEMTVKSSTGYRPAPAQPTFIDYLDAAIYYPFEFLDNSTWAVRSKVLVPTSENGGELLLRKDEERNYRFEVPFRLGSADDKVGVYAFYHDADNWAKVELGREGKWSFTDCISGVSEKKEFNLPEKYAFLDSNELVADYDAPWHTLTIYKNDNNFNVWLDYFNLTVDGPIASHHDKGTVGLCATSSTVAFDAIQYTDGFDEYDGNITGWSLCNADDAELQADSCLTLSSTGNEAIAYKGDPEWNYEFSAYMQNHSIPESGKTGFYPLWIDADNYVKAVVDYSSKSLDVEGRENGVTTYTAQYPLSRKQMRQYSFTSSSAYPTSTYTYDLRSESEVSGIDILWLEDSYPYLNQTFDIPNKIYIFAKEGSGWTRLDATLEGEATLGQMCHYTFPSTKTSALKMVLSPKSDKAARAFTVYVHEDLAADYYLRGRREADGVHIIIDDEQKCVVPGSWQQSAVALTAENAQPVYNGLLHYQSGAVKTTSITVDDADCAVGESVALNATVLPENATNKHLCWKSSNPDVVAVSADGVATRLADGEVTITAYTADGGIVKGTVTMGGSNAISQVVCENSIGNDDIYDLQGRKVTSMKPNNIYISNGKKRI